MTDKGTVRAMLEEKPVERMARRYLLGKGATRESAFSAAEVFAMLIEFDELMGRRSDAILEQATRLMEMSLPPTIQVKKEEL